MFSVTLFNTPANKTELANLGVREATGFCKDTTYLQIQLNLNVYVSVVTYDEIYSPMVNIEDVAPILMLRDTRSRVEYLQAYGFYTIDNYVKAREILETL